MTYQALLDVLLLLIEGGAGEDSPEYQLGSQLVEHARPAVMMMDMLMDDNKPLDAALASECAAAGIVQWPGETPNQVIRRLMQWRMNHDA